MCRLCRNSRCPRLTHRSACFCRLAGHYRRFIKGFANIARPLYNVLGKEVKMGLEGRGHLEGKGPVRACPSVPQLQKAFPVGNRCLQGRTWSGALSETKRWMVPSHCFWEPLPDPGGEELSLLQAGIPHLSRNISYTRHLWCGLTTTHSCMC